MGKVSNIRTNKVSRMVDPKDHNIQSLSGWFQSLSEEEKQSIIRLAKQAELQDRDNKPTEQ